MRPTLLVTSSWPICSVRRMISWSVKVLRSVVSSITLGGGSADAAAVGAAAARGGDAADMFLRYSVMI